MASLKSWCHDPQENKNDTSAFAQLHTQHRILRCQLTLRGASLTPIGMSGCVRVVAAPTKSGCSGNKRKTQKTEKKGGETPNKAAFGVMDALRNASITRPQRKNVPKLEIPVRISLVLYMSVDLFGFIDFLCVIVAGVFRRRRFCSVVVVAGVFVFCNSVSCIHTRPRSQPASTVSHYPLLHPPSPTHLPSVIPFKSPT